MAEHPHSITRRGSLAASVAAALIGAPAAAKTAAGLDADLLRLCAELQAHQDESERQASLWYDVVNIPEGVHQEMCARARVGHSIKIRLAAMPARTLEGLQAKARFLHEHFEIHSSDHPDDRLALSMCEDLLRLAPAALAA